jgi:hypothetical protein
MNDLTVSLEGIDHQLLLDEWRWLVPQRMTILSVTVLGDIFLRDSDGSVHWLDVAGGKLSKVADSESAFQNALRDEALRDNWFLPKIDEILNDYTRARLCAEPKYRPWLLPASAGTLRGTDDFNLFPCQL